jgi:hypothetical protein
MSSNTVIEVFSNFRCLVQIFMGKVTGTHIGLVATVQSAYGKNIFWEKSSTVLNETVPLPCIPDIWTFLL